MENLGSEKDSSISHAFETSSSSAFNSLEPSPRNVPPKTLVASSSRNSRRRYTFSTVWSQKNLARKVAAQSNYTKLQSINWRSFDDGLTNLFINNAHIIRGQHVAFLASFSSPCVSFEQLSVIFALPRLFVASFTLVLPFFPTGSFERMEEEGDVATTFTMARILSNIPISRGSPTSLVIYDIHALQERFYFGDHVLPCFETGIPLLIKHLRELPDVDNVCVIVDDLVQSSSTLVECQKVLAANDAAKDQVFGLITHRHNLGASVICKFLLLQGA